MHWLIPSQASKKACLKPMKHAATSLTSMKAIQGSRRPSTNTKNGTTSTTIEEHQHHLQMVQWKAIFSLLLRNKTGSKFNGTWNEVLSVCHFKIF